VQVDLVKPQEIPDLKDCKSLMLIAGEGCLGELKRIFPDISKQITFWGGVFPCVFFGSKIYYNKIVSVRFDKKINVFRENELPERVKGTLLIFADGMYPGVEGILENTFAKYGDGISYVGGGAGSLSLKPIDCLFDNRGFFRRGCLFANDEQKVTVAVRHGWEPLDESFIVTKSEKRDILELDWQPAFRVYKNVLEKYGKKINQDNFFDVAKEHPFGLAKVEGELVVRDPFITDGRRITCAGNVSQNSVIYLMKGDKEKLIRAAEQCGRSVNGKLCLVCDCISRVLYLDDDFPKEMGAINRDAFGPLTIGEIAAKGNFIEFFNKTIVACGIA